MGGAEIHASSFRDPSGFIYKKDGKLFRQINKSYQENFDHFISSGLYQKLLKKQLIIPHTEVALDNAFDNRAYKIIEPDEIGFISYPYEFSFSQLKDTALATLKIQKEAINKGMTLKDASSYNIQFHHGNHLLIDTLSFEIYKEGAPWVAYRQFCQHFLAPLVLIKYKDVRLINLMRVHIDGIPLDLASELLPRRSYLSFAVLSHIHLHAMSQKKYESRPETKVGKNMSRQAMLGLIDNLESFIAKLNWKTGSTEWGEYYEETNYSEDSMKHKLELVKEFLESAKPVKLWDMGANRGLFSRVASEMGIFTVSFDIDYLAVEKNYLEVKNKKETNLLPLHLDLTNPSPSIGWANNERMSLLERANCDLVMALALIHHLAISNNLPLDKIASFFASISDSLIIEFVPKSDSQVKRLLFSREDIFDNYDIRNFEIQFETHFKIIRKENVKNSERTLYLMRKKES